MSSLETGITSNTNRQTTEMGLENAAPLIERLGREAPPDQFNREFWKNAVEAGAKNIVISPCWRDLENSVAEGKAPVYRYQIADDGSGMTAAEIKKYLNQLSSSGHNLAVAGGNHGLGAKISALYWNPAGIGILSWKDGVGVAAKIWKDTRPNARTYGRYGLAPFELDDGSYSEFIEAPEEYKPDFIKDHGTIIILYGNGSDDTWQGPKGANGEPYLNKVYSHLLTLNSRFFRVPEDATTSIFSLKENKEDWPQSEAEARDRSATSARKGNTHQLQGMEVHLLENSQEHGTLEHPEFRIHWYYLKADRTHLSYHLSGGLVASLYQNEIYDLHRGRAKSGYMAQFGVFRGKVQENLVLIVEPDPANLMTDSSRSRLIDARIYERLSTEKLPWNQYGEHFKANMPEVVRAALADLAGGTEDISAAVKEEIKEYAPYMRRNYRVSGGDDTTKPVATKPKQRGTNSHSHNKGKKPKPIKTTPGDAASKETGGLPAPPHVVWVSEAEETLVKGRAAYYDIPNHTLLENKDFLVAKIEICRRLKEWNLDGNQDAENGIIEAVRHTYARKHIFMVMHHYQNRDTESWTSEEWERAVSPEALTAAVLGFKWAENSINRYLSTKFPELSQNRDNKKGLNKAKKIAKNIIAGFKTVHQRGKKRKTGKVTS